MDHIDFFASNTVNLTQLLNLLLARGMLLSNDVETINSFATAYEKNTELFLLLKKKGVPSEEFFSCLTQSGNEHIVNRLRPTNRHLNSNSFEPIWFDVKKGTTFYIGRKAEHEKMERICQEWRRNNILSFVILAGLGGSGKSEMAKHCAVKFSQVDESHCIWINAETTQTQLDSFQRLAKELEVSTHDRYWNPKELNILVEEIYKKITTGSCLLILDNVELNEYTLLHQLIKLADKGGRKFIHPFVLITTQCDNIEVELGNRAELIKLGNLDPISAFELIVKSLKLPDETRNEAIDDQIRSVCATLNHFPLVLQQAISFIRKDLKNSNVAHEMNCYMNAFKEESFKILNYNLPFLEFPEGTTVYKSCMVTMKKITRHNNNTGDVAVNLITMAAYFKNSPIHCSLLVEILKNLSNNNTSSGNINEVFDILASYSFCEFNKPEWTISMHKLVQDVVRCSLELEKKNVSTLEMLLSIVSTETFMESVASSQLIHLASLWCHAIEHSQLISNEKYLLLPELISERYIHFGLYYNYYLFASELYATAVKYLGQDHRTSLWLLYWKGCALEKIGKFKESRELLLDCHQKQNISLGPNDDHTLRSAQVIGSTFWHEKEYEEAIKWLEKVCVARNKLFGPDCKQTLVVKNNLALVLTKLNKHDEAWEILVEVFEVKKRIYGLDHIETLIANHNIGYFQFSSGKFHEAIITLEKVLKDKESFLGKMHPETLNSKHLIARALKKIPKLEQALDVARDTLEKRKETLGVAHPNTINTDKLVEKLQTKLMASESGTLT